MCASYFPWRERLRKSWSDTKRALIVREMQISSLHCIFKPAILFKDVAFSHIRFGNTFVEPDLLRKLYGTIEKGRIDRVSASLPRSRATISPVEPFSQGHFCGPVPRA